MMGILTIRKLLFFLLCATAVYAQTNTAPKPKSFFPYDVHEKVLPNGLHVVVIPTPEFKDMVTYATPVFAGSRNETEKGKTGLAHLFEHIMFLHHFGGKPTGYQDNIRRMGAHNNAWTNYDMTFYHPTTFTSNLVGPISRPDGPVPGLIEMEADRFKHLTLDRKEFEVQAGAVLGEYRRIFSFPDVKALEMYSPLAFPNHPYGHTVIGLREDVENMPQAWDAAWEFYHNYYSPNNVAIVVVGDVKPDFIFQQVEKYYADWKPTQNPAIPAEKQPDGEKTIHVPWEADVSPQLVVAYHTPAMKPSTKEGAVTFLLSELLGSRSAPLFQKLRYQKQTVTSFDADGGMILLATDPHLLVLSSELMLDRFRKDGDKYVNDVKADMISGVEALKTFSQQKDADETLRVIKSKMKNDLLARFDSVGDIADIYSRYYRFDKDPRVFDKLMEAVDSLTPADIDAYAKANFTADRRIVSTLWHDVKSGDTKQEVR
ncbi:MAG TPA: pitrilysin family protein [Terriglobales bacterium]|nr:pitrilysin family protein [Terriglobales bacterium]